VPPQVKDAGLYLKFMTNDIGFDLGLVGDLSFGYEVPYYSETVYNVLDSKFNLLLGGKSYFTTSFHYFRVTVWLEVIGAKATSSNRIYMDVVNSLGDTCITSDWLAETVKIVVTT
jgi:hypothetical protein